MLVEMGAKRKATAPAARAAAGVFADHRLRIAPGEMAYDRTLFWPTGNGKRAGVELLASRDFSTWIKDRIAKGQFVENVDYGTRLYRLPTFPLSPRNGEVRPGPDFDRFSLSM
jgi:hypothetical protein